MNYQGKQFLNNIDLSVSCERLENWGSLETLFPKAKSGDNIYCVSICLDNNRDENGNKYYLDDDGFEDVFVANPDVILGNDSFHKKVVENSGKFDDGDCFFKNKKSAMKVAMWLKTELQLLGYSVEFSTINI
jgi:hypothetical protein